MNYKKDNKLEKHFTTDELINEMFILLKKYYKDDITEYIETSAGDGRIIDKYEKDIPYIAFDIDPLRNDIKKCNYLKEDIDYKKGRVCIMNPPFMYGIKFLNKALNECDYVVTLLSQNSILNIDYSKIWCDEIQLWRNYNFGTCEVSISLIACRKKKLTDKYEYE